MPTKNPTVAWFHCFAGIAGDMALGALLDAGAELTEVTALIERLGVPGWELRVEGVQRAGIGATKARVTTADQAPHRTWGDIEALLAAAALPRRLHDRAAHTFALLAEVEGDLHGVPADEVHFHEVGALDAIVDVVGTCAALEVLGVDEVRSSPVAVGLGTVRAEHGVLPNPAPATLALLRRVGAPVRGIDVDIELATPTGAALLAALATGFGPLPAMVPSAIGYGAGGAELDGRPNVVQVVLGWAVAGGPAVTLDYAGGDPGQPVRLLEANVDDATGEVLALAVSALLEAGAHDAWITPIIMKKGRPAHTVHALCDVALTSLVAQTLTRSTGSLGLRGTVLERWPAARHVATVDVEGHPVRVKVSPGRVKAELDDAAAAAEVLGRPVRDVLAAAEASWPRSDASGAAGGA